MSSGNCRHLFLGVFQQTHGQGAITNVSELAQLLGKREWLYCEVLPWEVQVYPTDGQPLWADLSQFPDEFRPPATVALPEESGIRLLPLRSICNLVTGETIVRAEWSGEDIACIAPPSGYQPGDAAAQDTTVLRLWQQWQRYAEEWEDGIDPFLLVTLVRVADINDEPVYDANIAAADAAWEEAEAEGGQMRTDRYASRDDEGDGGLMLLMDGEACTNDGELVILSISQDTSGWTTLVWGPTSTNQLYEVQSSAGMSNPTPWTVVHTMIGNCGTSSWTDQEAAGLRQFFWRVLQLDFNRGGQRHTTHTHTPPSYGLCCIDRTGSFT